MHASHRPSSAAGAPARHRARRTAPPAHRASGAVAAALLLAAGLTAVPAAPPPARAESAAACTAEVPVGATREDLQNALDAVADCGGPATVTLAGDVTLDGTALVWSGEDTLTLRGPAPSPEAAAATDGPDDWPTLDADGNSRILTVAFEAESVTLERLVLTGGDATDAVEDDLLGGGAVAVEVGDDGNGVFTGPALTLSHVVATGNTADYGGAIVADALTLEDVELSDNTAISGGAVLTASLTATRTSFIGNVAAWPVSAGVGTADAFDGNGVGGAVQAGADVTLTNVTFDGNTAELGGALALLVAPDAGEGGPAASAAPALAVTFATFAGNAAASGAHVAVVDAWTGLALELADVSVRGSVLAGGTTVAGAPHCLGLAHAAVDATGSLTDGAGCPGGTLTGGLTAALGALEPVGEVGRTRTPVADGPLVDAVDCSVGSWPAEDQRGTARPQGDGCDVGAVELEDDGGGGDPVLEGFLPPLRPQPEVTDVTTGSVVPVKFVVTTDGEVVTDPDVVDELEVDLFACPGPSRKGGPSASGAPPRTPGGQLSDLEFDPVGGHFLAHWRAPDATDPGPCGEVTARIGEQTITALIRLVKPPSPGGRKVR